MTKNNLDLVGQNFGRLLVISDSKLRTKNRQTLWWCRCECGKNITVRTDSLKSGHTKSCGCLYKETRPKSKVSPQESIHNKILYTYKRNAKIRNIPWKLLDKDALEFLFKPCENCGRIFSNSYPKNNPIVFCNGIDRKNNTFYSKKECITLCTNCNRAKRIMTWEEFQNWMSDIIKFHSSKQ